MRSLARDGVVFDSAYCRQPTMRAVARLVHVRTFAVGALAFTTTQPNSRPTFRPSPIALRAARLSHDPLGQDALLRTRSAARIRAAADDRHLSRRLQLDAGLGPSRASSELVSQHELGARRRVMRALEPARLRRRDGLHGRARDLRHRARSRIRGPSCWSRRSRIRTTRSPFLSATGTSTATRTSTCRRRRHRARSRIRAVCATSARWIPSR